MEQSVVRASTFVDVVAARAEFSEKVAFEFAGPNEAAPSRLSFAELHDRAASIAALLAGRVAPGDRVLVLLPPGLDYVASFLGCLYAGVIAVPLYPSNGKIYSARSRAVFADSAPAAALVPGSVIDGGDEGAAGIAGLPLIAVDGELPAPGEWRRPSIDGDTVAFLQYTSGSTATPRGVVVTHRNLVANSRQIRDHFGTTPDTRVVSWLPPYHDMGLIGGILQPLFAGTTSTLFSPVSFIAQPLRWLRLISETGARISGGPNFAYDLCVDRIPEQQLAGLDLSRWEVAFNGAEPVRARTLERFADRMAPYGFRRGAFFPCYGLAEATLLVSGRSVGDSPIAETFDPGSLAPGSAPVTAETGLPVVGCGTVAGDLTVTVTDPETGAAVPPATVGEIRAAGDNVAAGYWGQDSTATFGQAPGDPLRTGDLGFLRDGQLFVTGRIKDLVVVRGRNHYPQDLEQSALDAHPSLRRGAAAFAVDRDDREEVCLVLETSIAHRPDEMAEAAARVRMRLATEHGVTPGSLVFVRPGQIPRTTSGKVQRAQARAMLADGSMMVAYRWDAGPAGNGLAPLPEHLRSEITRETLLDLLRQRLGSDVDPAAPLVAQGLDSLAALELRAAVERATGQELPLAGLLAGATVDTLLDDLTEHTRAAAPPVTATSSGRHPLAYGQQALWILEQQHPDSSVQHIYAALRFRRPVDVGALHRTFQTLTDRHPALRTSLHWAADGESYQQVHRRQEVDFLVEDASGLDEGEFAARIRREILGERLDLAAGRPLQVTLFRRPAGDVLSMVLHHVAGDMWSVAVLTDELGRLYTRETGGNVTVAPAPVADFVEYGRRQRALLDSPHGQRLWEYWKNELDGSDTVLELPADRPRPPALTYQGDTVSLTLDSNLTAALRTLSAGQGTTLFVTLMAVFQTLVRRYTRQDDFLIGVPASGRGDEDMHGVVGYFVNPVLIRTRDGADRSFADQIAETRQKVAGAMRHQDMPFPVLVERLGLVRDASRPPGYQVMFSFTRSHLPDGNGIAALNHGKAGVPVRIGGLEAESLDMVRRTAQVDLTMVVSEVGDHLEAGINFSTDIFDRETVERFGADFAELARRLEADPRTPMNRIPSIRDEELRQIAAWNDTSTRYPRESSVVELFAEQVAARPGEPALTYGALTRTYRELDAISGALAHRLIRLGVRPEDRVGLYVDRDPAVVVAMLAIAKAGAAYVPLDPAHPPHRLLQILDESAPVLILAPDDRTAGAAAWNPGLPTLDPAGFLDVPAGDAPTVTAGPSAESLLYVMYTSGSSGTPKGICITHRNVVRLVRGTGYFSLAPGDRMAQVSNAAFDAATLEIWGALLNGGHLIGFDKQTVLSPPRLATALRDHDIHTVVLATPLFAQLTGYDPKTFAGTRQLLVGGDSMDPKRAREVAELGGPLLTNGYGPTESTTFATTQPLPVVADDVWRLPIGGPIANTRVYVLDEQWNPVPVGVPGQLFIGGDGLGRGYLGRPALTAEKFVPDPFSDIPGSRMYATGDLARWLPGGVIDFLGRIDFQVKVRGFRIELGDIDAALTSHPGVGEAVTVVDESTGDKRLAAFYSGTVETAELTAHLTERLPEYMVPGILVRLDELPKNPNRKIDRAALRVPTGEGAPVTGGDGGSDLEGEIVALLTEVLGRADVDPDDNFFEIGGHSLLAIRLLAQIKQTYGVDLDLSDLFTDPTARAVAEQIAERRGAVPEPAAATGPTAVSRDAYAARRPR
ncbi:putative NRPS [Actinoplanes missouriensis 431]|uniref:Putative NRPS n=1 Tax=Actinoplanes missouriensis (strain ATCC 14538 / DSM 43046 / CBS 188.64 / JCM 3121 / NBRC 102363 / NCIMB 12654 / NRRL B-3342 / UNCC 431) TaxID=512565 RepID=I0HAZ8_ACTM4|nr:non-ribosomal peptide synthetase [Actinoplanes missouriensis]BAL90185.1 putative NRPS [Actinoplanes missouriensis 431]